MKRWSIWLLVAAMVVMGLGSTANAETVLKVWAHHHPPRVEKTQALLDEFERLNPDITIEFTTMPYDAYWNKLLPSMAAGTGPDVLHVHGSWTTKFVDAKVWEPVPETVLNEIQIGEWYEGVANAYKRNGKYYGLPYASNTWALYYNRDLFAEAGLDPEAPPVTWADLITYGKKLTKFDNGKMVQSGFGLKTKGTHSMLDYFAILNQMGGTVLDENGRPALDTPVAKEALSFYVSLVKEHRLNDPDFLPGDEGFAQGKTAMHTAGSWFGDQMDLQYPDLDYGVALMPRVEGGLPLTCDIGSWGWSVSARSKNKDAAMRLFAFLNTRDAHVALFGVEGMPARADVVADPRIQQLVAGKPELDAFMQGAEYSMFIGDTIDWPKFEAAITARLESIFYDNVSVDEAAAGMQKDAEKIIKR